MKKTLAFAAMAAVLAAPAFAQTHVQSSSHGAVTSSSGIAVTPGAPQTQPPLPGATVSGNSSTTQIVGAGPAPGSSSVTTTTVTRYWVNVPPDVERDDSFRRWQKLK